MAGSQSSKPLHARSESHPGAAADAAGACSTTVCRSKEIPLQVFFVFPSSVNSMLPAQPIKVTRKMNTTQRWIQVEFTICCSPFFRHFVPNDSQGKIKDAKLQ